MNRVSYLGGHCTNLVTGFAITSLLFKTSFGFGSHLAVLSPVDLITIDQLCSFLSKAEKKEKDKKRGTLRTKRIRPGKRKLPLEEVPELPITAEDEKEWQHEEAVAIHIVKHLIPVHDQQDANISMQRNMSYKSAFMGSKYGREKKGPELW